MVVIGLNGSKMTAYNQTIAATALTRKRVAKGVGTLPSLQQIKKTIII